MKTWAKLCAAGVLCTLVCTSPASAVDFTAQGEWLWGFGGVDGSLLRDKGGKDMFDARQRIRLQMEAATSESLSGTVNIQIGDMAWGKGEDGGALGADGKILRLRDAYIDWLVPSTDLRLRMGMQGVALPNAAGGSSILDEQSMAVVGHWKLNDKVGLSAFWLRPFNDNYEGYGSSTMQQRQEAAGFLDNADYVGVSLPLTLEGLNITPWAMLGFVGRNAIAPHSADGQPLDGPLPDHSLPFAYTQGMVQDGSFRTGGKPYATQFFVGLPLVFSALDPWNMELDINYGSSSGWGSFHLIDRLGQERRADSSRQGWLIKGLVEYKMDWGTPGILAWYASGDDGNVGNGSERMPSIAPSANFTSFMQDGDLGWSVDGGYDLMLSYAGTWGLGLQLKDISSLEHVSHTLRAVYWGGTNSQSMMRHSQHAQSWSLDEGLYLTTGDHLVEFNVDSTWSIRDNLQAVVELGYIVNGIDAEAWSRHTSAKWQKADAWKAACVLK